MKRNFRTHVILLLAMAFSITSAQEAVKEVKDDVALTPSSTVGRYTTSPREQFNPHLVQNGTEGVYAMWNQDHGGTTLDDAVVQRINTNNGMAWDPTGRVLSNTDSSQVNPVGISDGAGGVISAFADKRDGEWRVYAMRNSPTGGQMWGNDGVLLGTRGLTGPEVPIQIVTDGAGGAIVVWEDEFSATDHDIIAQRIDAAGNIQWSSLGQGISRRSDEERNPAAISDGAGGAIIAWEDDRDGPINIYASRIDASGNGLWASGGSVLVNDASTIDRVGASMALDTQNSVIFSWTQNIGATDTNIEYSKFDFAGTKSWGDFRLRLGALSFDNSVTVIPSINSVIIVWESNLENQFKNVYANRIDQGGGLFWGTASSPVRASDSLYLDNNSKSRAISDGAGGIIIVYEREFSTTDHDIWAQHIPISGTPQWTTGSTLGKRISSLSSEEQNPTIASDGAGGAFIAWEDNRNGDFDIYGEHLLADGSAVGIGDDDLTSVPNEFLLDQNYPNPFNPSTQISFSLPNAGSVSLTVYNMMGQKVRTLASESFTAGNHQVQWFGNDDLGNRVASGLYLYRLETQGFVQTRKMMLVR